MVLLQNPRGLHSLSPSQRLPRDLCVPQITLWDLLGHMVQGSGLFVSQHEPDAELSLLWIPLKTDSLACHLVCELEQNSKLWYMLALKPKEAFQALYFSLSGRSAIALKGNSLFFPLEDMS